MYLQGQKSDIFTRYCDDGYYRSKNGCKIIRSDNGYECKTKCVMLKKDKLVHWEFKALKNASKKRQAAT